MVEVLLVMAFSKAMLIVFGLFVELAIVLI
jgi:hypothetical protein